ncbi:MAG: hypothetical protein V2B15_09885 [Bacteroidota bacterium]
MKKLIPVFFLVMILATGCPQTEPEVPRVEIGLFTPYAIFPESLNGKVKEVVEKSYQGIEKDGKIIKGERLTKEARDTINWSDDFRVTFDENGTLLECVKIDENDEIIDKQTLTVEGGRILKGHYTKNDTLRSYSVLSYDGAGHIAKVEQYTMPADTMLWSVQFITDEQGKVSEWQFMDPKGNPTTKYIFTVDQDNRRTGYKFYNREGELAFEERFTYNDKGFMEKQVMINKAGEETVSAYEFEYDGMNNWVKVTGNSDQYPLVSERTITYYRE